MPGNQYCVFGELMENSEVCYPRLDLDTYLFDKESRTVTANIGHDDAIVHVARQKRLSGAFVSPSVIVLTAKKVIIVNRLIGGAKSDISFISHQDIASLRIAHGVMFSSVYVRIRGSVGELGKIFKGETEEGEINGLAREDADYIFARLNDMRKGIGTGHHVHNYFAYGQVVNHFHKYGKDNENGAWSDANNDQLGTPYRLVQQEVGNIEPVLGIEGASHELLLPERAEVIVGNGMVQHVLKVDDLLIFKLRKEHPDEYSTQ